MNGDATFVDTNVLVYAYDVDVGGSGTILRRASNMV